MRPSLPLILPRRNARELQTNLRETLARKPGAEAGVWLFVYGLLAKSPPFKFVRCEVVELMGWRRRFHLADPLNRGTPEAPGLTLGLEAGGICAGLAYLLSDLEAEEGLKAVWEQEMLLPFYTPQWIAHGERELLTMVTDTDSPALWQPLSVDEVGRIIGTARGQAGTNRQYLMDVIEAFGGCGIEDEYLADVRVEVEV